MNTLWVVLGLGVVGSVIALVTSWRRGDRQTDMGAVSSQWIAEQRLGSGSDARR